MDNGAWLVWAILWAYICYQMAGNRKRDKMLGAFLGFMFGLIAVIGYRIAGNKKKGK